MATGIPKKNANAERTNYNNVTPFYLEYEGKAPLERILAVQLASLKTVISIAGQPKNNLIYGENLRVLRSLLECKDVAGRVRLIYIDPPYATGYQFECRKQTHAYQDLILGAEYLEALRWRLVLLRELLAEDGSIYVHLDVNMAFPVKVLMDEIFGAKNFRNWITRKKCNPKNYTRKQYGNVSDYILFYSKTDKYVWNQPFNSWTEETSKKEYQYIEEETGRIYKKVPIHAPGVRRGATGQPWRSMMPPPGKHWQYLPSTLDEMDARGEIYWSPTGNPRRKVYLDQSSGIPVQDIWLDYKDAHNQNIRITGYPTEKNSGLLRRIIQASSNKMDLVLDAYSGSGTTAAVAEELGRQWIAIDNALPSLEVMVKRLSRGTEPMGDFVKGKDQVKQFSLDLNRILRNGLDIKIEESDDLESIPQTLIEEWFNMLNFPANL